MANRRHLHRRQPSNGLRSPTWISWTSAKSRCFNPNAAGYASYGGRGITVCARWLDFANFLADMGERPEGTSLDRIDGTKGYEPGNCRWATRAQQSRNRYNVRFTEEDVLEIRGRLEHGETQRSVAVRFGIEPKFVNALANNGREDLGPLDKGALEAVYRYRQMARDEEVAALLAVAPVTRGTRKTAAAIGISRDRLRRFLRREAA